VDLTDQQWAAVEPLLPVPEVREDGRRRPWRDPRDVLNGILWILRTGAPWADMPSRYPPYSTCFRRFQSWVEDEVLQRVLQALADDLVERGKLDLTETFIDGTHAGTKRGANLWEKLVRAADLSIQSRCADELHENCASGVSYTSCRSRRASCASSGNRCCVRTVGIASGFAAARAGACSRRKLRPKRKGPSLKKPRSPWSRSADTRYRAAASSAGALASQRANAAAALCRCRSPLQALAPRNSLPTLAGSICNEQGFLHSVRPRTGRTGVSGGSWSVCCWRAVREGLRLN